MHVPRDVAECLGEFLGPRDRARWFVACGLRTCVDELREHILNTLARMVRDGLSMHRIEDDFKAHVNRASALGFNARIRTNSYSDAADITCYDERAGIELYYPLFNTGPFHLTLFYHPDKASECTIRTQLHVRDGLWAFSIPPTLPLDLALVVLRASREAQM